MRLHTDAQTGRHRHTHRQTHTHYLCPSLCVPTRPVDPKYMLKEGAVDAEAAEKATAVGKTATSSQEK